MRVLITGATGFLGRYMLDRLGKHGISTVVAGRTSPTHNVPADFIKVDLLGNIDFRGLVADSGATHLLHLAWYAEHGKYWSAPVNLRWTEATVRLVEAFCLSGGKQVVVSGTCAEYDWSHGYCVENKTPLNPETLYGISKDATRRLTSAVCAEHDIPCAWGRIFLPYGRGEDGRRLIPSLVDVFKGKRDPFGVNASAYRDFLHAGDLAEGFIKLMRNEVVGAYNICSGQPVRIEDLVVQIALALGADPETVLGLTTERPGEPPFLVGDNRKLKALGWSVEHSLDDILANIDP